MTDINEIVEILEQYPEKLNDPEIRALYNSIMADMKVVDKRLKENRLEVYNVGEKIHKKQIEFHKSSKRIKALFGGNRTGKTVAGAVEAITHALGDCRFRKLKPSSGWVVSLTNEVQRDVAQKEILKWLPKKEIAGIYVRHGTKSDPENATIDFIVLKNGCRIGFKTCEQGRKAFQGTSQGWIWFDEEPDDEGIYKECRMRLMDTRGDMWFTMTPLMGLTWVYNLVYLNENNNPNIEYWMMEWADNPFLSSHEIAELEATMTEEEREARQYGRFTSLSGFAFPELRKDIHIRPIQPVPEWYRKYVSLDYGLDSLAVLWIWMDNYGHARVYKALRKKNLIIAEAAKEIKIYTGPDKINAYYGPPDLWSRRNDTGKSAAMIFHENGINLIKASNNREHGWMNTHEWLRPYETRDEQTGEAYKAARLTFDEGLDPDLWKHLTTIQRDEKNPNDVAVTPHEVTHYPDALRYFCAARPIMAKQPENEKKYNFSFERPQKRDSYFGGEVTSDYLNYGG